MAATNKLGCAAANDNIIIRHDFGAALYVSSRNANLVMGLPWQAVLALAKQHDIVPRTISSRRSLIPAGALVHAVEAEPERYRAQFPLTEQEELNALLRSWGVERGEIGGK